MATPNGTISAGDVTPASQPPPLGFVFRPTDADIIELLECKVNHVPLIGDMVKHVDFYQTAPDILVKQLHPYVVDGNPHFLVFTETQHKRRNVEGDLKGCWRPHGERSYITDERTWNVVGTKQSYTYDDGNVKNKNKGTQRSIWKMIEYQISSETGNTDHLKYTICKLYNSDCKAFKEREAAKSLARELRDEIFTLERRGGGEGNNREVIDKMKAYIVHLERLGVEEAANSL